MKHKELNAPIVQNSRLIKGFFHFSYLPNYILFLLTSMTIVVGERRKKNKYLKSFIDSC